MITFLVITIIIIMIAFLCIISNNGAFLFLVDNSEYRLWKKLEKEYKTLVFNFNSNYGDVTYYNWGELEVICWHDDKHVAIFNEMKCLASSFWKKKSKKMYQLITEYKAWELTQATIY